MKPRRLLVLKRETLTPLTAPELAAIVGANGLQSLLCITDKYRTTCLNCE